MSYARIEISIVKAYKLFFFVLVEEFVIPYPKIKQIRESINIPKTHNIPMTILYKRKLNLLRQIKTIDFIVDDVKVRSRRRV